MESLFLTYFIKEKRELVHHDKRNFEPMPDDELDSNK